MLHDAGAGRGMHVRALPPRWFAALPRSGLDDSCNRAGTRWRPRAGVLSEASQGEQRAAAPREGAIVWMSSVAAISHLQQVAHCSWWWRACIDAAVHWWSGRLLCELLLPVLPA